MSQKTKMQTRGVWCTPLGCFKPPPVNSFHKTAINPVFSYISETKEQRLRHPNSDFSESLLTHYSESWTLPRSPGRTSWNLVCGQVKTKFLSTFLFLCWLSFCSCYWFFFVTYFTISQSFVFCCHWAIQFTLVLALAWVTFSSYHVKEVNFSKDAPFLIKNPKRNVN